MVRNAMLTCFWLRSQPHAMAAMATMKKKRMLSSGLLGQRRQMPEERKKPSAQAAQR
jgi:hypothetical protein